MKKLIVLLFSVLLLSACGEKGLKVTVENPSDFDRSSELVELSVEGVKEVLPLHENQGYIITDSKGTVVPSQVTSDGKLLFQSGLAAKAKETYTITTGQTQSYEAKTYGRFIKERKDDFAWENDRVAFRIYGPALVESDGPSNGLDIWYKKTNKLIVEKWYKDDLSGKASYHEDHGEGLDDYKVGRSLGAGAMAPFVGEKLWLNDNFTSEELLDNGPLRTTFKLNYKDITVDGKTFSESRIFSIDAGSQYTKVVQAYGTTDAMEVAAGIVKRESGDSIVTGKDYLIYAEPTTDKVSGIYVGLVFPEGMKKSVVDTYEVEAKVNGGKYQHVLGIADYKPSTPLTYYTGYGWKEFGFATITDFEKYTQNFVAACNQPLIVNIVK